MIDHLVIATGNAGKRAEIKSLLTEVTIHSQDEFQIESPEETGLSFIENAILKARHAAEVSGYAALADDSGLEVDALDGAPGIYSARYAGADASDSDNTRQLLAALDGIPEHRRGARFRCAIAVVRHARDPSPIIAEGQWAGCITRAPRGDNGFGYDPVFWLPEHGLTAAQLPAAEKNRLSHRAQALAALKARLQYR